MQADAHGVHQVLNLLDLLVQKSANTDAGALRSLRSSMSRMIHLQPLQGAQFTCCTSTKVQILTPEEPLRVSVKYWHPAQL